MTRSARRCCDALTFLTIGLLAVLGCQNFRGSSSSWAPRPLEDVYPADLAEPQAGLPTHQALAAAAQEPVLDLPDPENAVRGEQLRQQLEPLARQLAGAASKPGLHFSVEVLKSARPRVYHCDDGQIFVSTGLLDRLGFTDELATVLALEMAETLIEQQGPLPSKADLPSTGPDDDFRQRALSDKVSRSASAAAQRQIEWLAGQILLRAGIHGAEVPVMAARLRAFETGEPPAVEITRPFERTTF